MELPVSCLALGPARLPFGGGFYLRFLPLALTRSAIRHTLRQGRPVVFYVHPWELDPAQPRLELPAQVAATRYYRLGSTARKLTALLREFRWTTLDELAAGCAPLRSYVASPDGRRGPSTPRAPDSAPRPSAGSSPARPPAPPAMRP